MFNKKLRGVFAFMKFEENLLKHKINIQRNHLDTLQINIGKKCNQACKHCHVDAGPNRTENMQLNVINHLTFLLSKCSSVKTIDITGGAPELNTYFKKFIVSLRGMNKKVIDRCNLTVLHEIGQEDTAIFLANHQVEIIASLPCYQKENVDLRREATKKTCDILFQTESLWHRYDFAGQPSSVYASRNIVFLNARLAAW